MPDPSTSTYLGLQGYILLWLLALVAFYFFGRRVVQLVQLLRRARPEYRWDQVPKRAWLFVTNVFGQPRLFDEPAFGAAHFLIFWTFVFYATSFFWNLLRGLFPFVPVPYADDISLVAIAMEWLSVLCLLALGAVAVRRYIFTPPSLERTRDATLVLGLITVLLLTFLGGVGAKALGGETAAGWSPGSFLGQAFANAGIAPESARSLYLWMWWIHMATVLGFLAYLPYSKHMHLLASPFGVFFASLGPGAMPPASEGADRLEEFTWRQLYSALACAECGRCDRACPAFAAGFPLSPKLLIHHVKEALLPCVAPGNAGGTKLIGNVVQPEEIWSCTTCLACMERCPVFNEHIPLLTEMRRHLVFEGDVETGLQDLLANLTRYGNSFGQSPRSRTKWTKGLDFKIKDARKEPVEYLWYVGDYASFDARLQRITQAAARIFHDAELDFGILYEGEQNTGNDARRIGEEGLFELLRDKNLKVLAKARFQKIVSTDPHTYHALKNEYANGNGGFGRDGVEVLHYTELLDRLLREGRLRVRQPLEMRVTYHDPCYLGRYNKVYQPPRRVIEALGAKLVEMERTRDKAFCCGGGGGRMWMEDVPGIKERPAENRIREAGRLADVDRLVVSCPKDLVMFKDALKTTGLEGSMEVTDVMELVEEAVGLPERSELDEYAQAQR
jgi:Fe-S oxidoreductase